MCGIVGLFLKDKSLEPQLGQMLSEMLVTMTDRGPDSAGIAIYGAEDKGMSKITVQSDTASDDYETLAADLEAAIGVKVAVATIDTHAVIDLPSESVAAARLALKEIRSNVRVMSAGDTIEIYKEVGLPVDVAARFNLESMTGSHAIGHTRMATESAVTTLGAHPFSTGADQCLVHNGSMSNHNSLRRRLIRDGMTFETENDTEVAAAYLSHKMQEGSNLGEALEAGLVSQRYWLKLINMSRLAQSIEP
jgi:glutamate synthase domain-containing protein 1